MGRRVAVMSSLPLLLLSSSFSAEEEEEEEGVAAATSVAVDSGDAISVVSAFVGVETSSVIAASEIVGLVFEIIFFSKSPNVLLLLLLLCLCEVLLLFYAKKKKVETLICLS